MKCRWNKCDSGKANSKWAKEKRDCTVRAMANATGLSYHIIHAYLESRGRKYGTGFHLERLMDKACKDGLRIDGLDYAVNGHYFPAEKGKPRMNVERFCEAFPIGTFVLRCAGHLTSVVDGELRDTDGCRDGKACVYKAWEVSFRLPGETAPTAASGTYAVLGYVDGSPLDKISRDLTLAEIDGLRMAANTFLNSLNYYEEGIKTKE